MPKTKTIARKTMDDPELQNMFNQMVGASDPDPRIVAPKYESILSDAKAIMGIFKKTFVDSTKVHQQLKGEFNIGFETMKEFCISGIKDLDDKTLEKKELLAGKDTVHLNSEPEKLQLYLQGLNHGYNNKELGETYKALKESATIEKIIVAARDLRAHVQNEQKKYKKPQHDIEDKTKLSDNFISKYDGDFLQLIPSITPLDFRQLFIHDSCDYSARQLIVYALHLFLKRAMNIVQKIMSPDIDVTAFSEKLVKSIDEIRKVLPRCDKAFNKIKQSVSMLKDNFGGYYKDFVISKNPGIIVENFVLDVADGSKADRETTMQFRKIVQFYRKKMQGKVKDPKIQKIFDLVGQNLEVLEEKTGRSYKGSRVKKEDKEDKTESEPKKPLTADEKKKENDSWLADSNVSGWKKTRSQKKKK